MSNAELIEAIKHEYVKVRELSDGSIAAVGLLMFTTAIYLGCDRYGWARRFCFEDARLAMEQFDKLQTEDDEPQGYVARR